jgi:type IV fimbrial biogenesis protein FimT
MLVMRSNQYLRGFNMIELAVVMGVIAIVSTVAFPSFMNMIGNSQIRSTAESFRNGLQLARAEAVTRNQLVRFKLNADNSWEVGCVNVVGDANGDGVDDCPAIITQKAGREGSGGSIQVTKVGSDNVIFNSFGSQASILGQLERIDIDNPSLNATTVKKLAVTVSFGGSVRMCEPAITVLTDPRKC